MRLSLHYGLNLVNPDAYHGWDGWLNACVNDATAMAALFARFGFAARATLNEDCTLKTLDQQLAHFATGLKPGDTFALTFSGHGGRSGAWTWSGYQETLCLYDGQLTDTALRDLLARFAPGVNLVIILDACHSGGMDRTRSPHKIRAAPQFATASVPYVPSVPSVPSRTPPSALFLTACRADETALDGDRNGAYTGSLLQAATQLRQPPILQPFTWQNWHLATVSLMAKNFPAQHPCLIPLNTTLPSQPIFP